MLGEKWDSNKFIIGYDTNYNMWQSMYIIDSSPKKEYYKIRKITLLSEGTWRISDLKEMLLDLELSFEDKLKLSVFIGSTDLNR